MRVQSASSSDHPDSVPGGASPARFLSRSLLWRYGFALRLAGCFLAIVSSIELVSFFGSDGNSGNLIWVANGMLLAYLLLAPRWRWPAYLLTGLAAMVAGSALIHEPWHINLLYNALDMIEVVAGAWLLRRRSNQLPNFTDFGFLIRFLSYAVLAGPLLSGAVYAAIEAFWWHNPPLSPFTGWVISDGLGIAVACPIFVAIFQSRRRPAHSWRHKWIYMTLLVAVTAAVFAQAAAPMLFLIYPVLILVLLHLGLGWAALALLFEAFAGGWFTLQGRGPLAASGSLSMEGRCLLLQIFVAGGMFMIYSVSVVLESRRASERKLEKIVSLHNLITENSRDAIIVADFAGRRSYVSSVIERLSGWPAEKFAALRSLDLVHPDELEAVRATLRSLRDGAEGALFECRVRTYRGDYMWVEANLRLVRDARTDAPSGILNIVRDISERKQQEQLRAFQHSLIRAINQASLDGILVVDSDRRIVSCNPKLVEIWKLGAASGLAALDADDPSIDDERMLMEASSTVRDPQGFIARVQELYADPDAIDLCEIAMNDGRTIERYSTSLRSEAGEYLGRVWFFRDITERKQSEKNLQDAYTAVEALAATDALTGLANRRRFDQALATEWRRSLRDGTPLSLLMIDVDLFKSYNDTYGHTRGDNCLKQIAETAQDVVTRPGDLVARFGGEEFAVILPNTDSTGALQLAAEILTAMRDRRLPHGGSQRGIVTVSVGCATLVARFGQHVVTLVEAADGALYEAKNGGRDRLASSGDSQQESLPARERADRQTIKKSA